MINERGEEFTFRSFKLFVYPRKNGGCGVAWHGPNHWRDAIVAACKVYCNTNGFGGMGLIEYLDALDIGRNVPKQNVDKAEEKI